MGQWSQPHHQIYTKKPQKKQSVAVAQIPDISLPEMTSVQLSEVEQRGISEISSTIVWETDSQVQVFLQATESQFHRFVFYRTLQSLWNDYFSHDCI